MPKVEDRTITPKENYLRVLTGQMPEWVPIYTMGAPLPDGATIPITWVTPLVLEDPHAKGGGNDIWGVNWVGSYETGGALLPEPNNFILDDITNWHDVIKAPDISDVDWEMMCKKTMDLVTVDREQTAIGLNLYVGTFQQLVAFMGFTEGLIAMIEEPEETYELCKYVNDFYIEVAKHCMEYIKPDVLVMTDDTASANAPFMSEELFRQILLPTYKDMTETLCVPYGIPAQFHNCGTAANFIEICHEEAHVTGWDPAQPMNDLVSFKEKWGRDIAIMGGFSVNEGELLNPDCPDELIVETARRAIDQFAPGGGYVFMTSFIGPVGDEKVAHKNRVLKLAAMEYGACFYD